MVLITYDVETSTEGGARRLRRVAKACMDYGMRVQNSVFECVLDQAQYVNLRVKILGIIDRERDSVRFYLMGKNCGGHIDVIGRDPGKNQESILIF